MGRDVHTSSKDYNDGYIDGLTDVYNRIKKDFKNAKAIDTNKLMDWLYQWIVHDSVVSELTTEDEE